MRTLPLLMLLLLVSACGSKSPTSPSTTAPPTTTPPPASAPPPAPTPTIGVLAGRVTQSGAGFPLGNARVEIIGGNSTGRSTLTNPNGEYTLPDVNLGNNTIRVSLANYLSRDLGIVLSGATTTQNVALQTVVPWSISGTGNQVFDVPTWLSRVRIIGTYPRNCENFIMWIGNGLAVNEILGTCSIGSGPRYEGTHQITGGSSRVEGSTGVSWSVTELR